MLQIPRRLETGLAVELVQTVKRPKSASRGTIRDVQAIKWQIARSLIMDLVRTWILVQYTRTPIEIIHIAEGYFRRVNHIPAD